MFAGFYFKALINRANEVMLLTIDPIIVVLIELLLP
jgi:hypothetical protein